MAIKLTCGKGEESLNSDDRLILDNILEEYEEKILKHGEKIDYFEVHVKCHQKEGKSRRYALQAKIAINESRFETSADEYDIKIAVHKLMKKLMSEIDHKIIREKDERLKGR